MYDGNFVIFHYIILYLYFINFIFLILCFVVFHSLKMFQLYKMLFPTSYHVTQLGLSHFKMTSSVRLFFAFEVICSQPF